MERLKVPQGSSPGLGPAIGALRCSNMCCQPVRVGQRKDGRHRLSAEARHFSELADRRASPVGDADHVVADGCFLFDPLCTKAHYDEGRAGFAVDSASILVTRPSEEAAVRGVERR